MNGPWWKPENFTQKRPLLEQRAALLRALRAYFDEQGFCEVDTPALQVSPGMEPHLTPFRTDLAEPFEDGRQVMYLHTSPEFAMKKLLVAGMPKIYQLAKVFRNEERSDLHHPEFTMLEWYRTGEGLDALMNDCAALLALCGLSVRPEVVSVAEAFFHHTGIDVLATLDGTLDPDPAPLAVQARALGIAVGAQDRWEDIYFRIFLEKIEPKLGQGRPTFLTDYPAPMAALARRNPDDLRTALRFELYVGGVELANAFDELTDADEQRARFEHDAALRNRLYGQEAVIDEDFLAALDEGLPPCAGIALGIDRLIMLATGARTINQVLWAPVG